MLALSTTIPSLHVYSTLVSYLLTQLLPCPRHASSQYYPHSSVTRSSTSSFVCPNSLYQHLAWIGKTMFINMFMYLFECDKCINNSYYKRYEKDYPHFSVGRTEKCSALAQEYIANKRQSLDLAFKPCFVLATIPDRHPWSNLFFLGWWL